MMQPTPLSALRNQYGKPFDELDAAMIGAAITAKGITGGYAVISEDGVPMMGFVPNDGKREYTIVATGWNK